MNDEIKIGDIVEPITKVRNQRFGTGIVTASRQAQRLPITAVFPASGEPFRSCDFEEKHLEVKQVSRAVRKQITDAAHNYHQFMEAVKHA